MRIRLGAIVVLGTALFAGAACASSPARAAGKVPLETPEPPPRAAMDPVPAVVVAEPVVPERPAVAPAARPPSLTPSPPASTISTPATAALPPVTVEPPRTTPAPELRPAGGAGVTPTAAQVRERIARTKQKLDRIGRAKLNAGKRTDYDSARRFLTQAEAAVKENNLLLAESSAEKAETLADGLR